MRVKTSDNKNQIPTDFTVITIDGNETKPVQKWKQAYFTLFVGNMVLFLQWRNHKLADSENFSRVREALNMASDKYTEPTKSLGDFVGECI